MPASPCVSTARAHVCVYVSAHLSAILWNAASLGSFESTLGFQKPKSLWSFFLPYPEENPLSPLLLSLSAGMNAHVEMLARLHTRTKFSHTKARGERGGGGGETGLGGRRGGGVERVGDERASRRKIKGSRGSAPLTPPPRFIKICLPIPTLILTQSLPAQTDAESTPLPQTPPLLSFRGVYFSFRPPPLFSLETLL